MKKISCEMCGSPDVVKQDGLFVCQSCGTKYSPEEAKKLIVEGSVKLDDSDSVNNLRVLAYRKEKEGKFAEAEELFTKIVEKSPYDHMAVYHQHYCNSSKDRQYYGVGSESIYLESCFRDACHVIAEMPIEEDKRNALRELISYTFPIMVSESRKLMDIAFPDITPSDDSTPEWHFKASVQSMVNICGDSIDEIFPDDDEFNKIKLTLWKIATNIMYISEVYPVSDGIKKLNQERYEKNLAKIRKFEPEYAIA
ncbi:TFIIB-type zinc finger domain-containing protein [Butyrivibrio sp. AE3004]|uniref:TFIIB-type zinc finger domain-containing protein n=1 Tax=Butyrivibrio sp. AE3004 TaxID=1506994 RepID=UPI0004944479|nr:TFIIB-type zinc finger domain-containing protein [Butyrivibrio sp. AE3004]